MYSLHSCVREFFLHRVCCVYACFCELYVSCSPLIVLIQMSWSTQKPQGAVTLKYNNNPVWSMAFQRSSDGNTRGEWISTSVPMCGRYDPPLSIDWIPIPPHACFSDSPCTMMCPVLFLSLSLSLSLSLCLTLSLIHIFFTPTHKNRNRPFLGRPRPVPAPDHFQ